ncbi:amidase [Bradyrhizobium aeschynomenes]|uniref:amidase n=1 Tax=Bradyrhizobium aeschynomenes TaxID=2734909 RepID=UPI0015526826|nr:amidase [Bradyrhizobium aeschynomenes]NPV20235.1 amidase [Bradyrhizobium aeschynomenes]
MRAIEIARAVTARHTTAAEMAEQALARIAASDLNAIVTTDPERTRADAEAVDLRVASGETLALAGVPIAVKDNIWVEGWRITQGSRLFADFVAPEDAIAIARLRRAGAVIVGIGATSEFACKGVTTSPLYGPTHHPRDSRLTPGGSSGGPAAAVAAGLVPLAIGTDAGGSSRRPPAHVGVVGFKPSYGAIPYGPGFAEPFWRISVIAPITTDVADARLAFDVMAGADARDPDSFDLSSAAAGAPLRLAFSPRLGLDVAVDDEVSGVLQQAVERLRASGLAIVDRDPVWPSGLAEDAVMPLQHAGLAALYGDTFRSDPAQFDPDIAKQIERGLTLSGANVGRALEASTQIARAFAAFFTEVDILLAPTVPCVAWPLTQLGPFEIGGKPAAPRAHAVFTPYANHAGVPAISIPCGNNAQGLPFGLQLIAARGHDRVLLDFTARAERVLQG